MLHCTSNWYIHRCKNKIYIFVQFSGIENKDEKQQYLQLAKENDLDVQEITKRVVENIKNRTSYEFSRETDVTIDTSISEVTIVIVSFYTVIFI